MDASMYESFFGLKKRPFTTIPSLDRYFPGEGIEQAYRTVVRAIERAEGPVAVMGPTGVGKTLLCLRIADTWRRSFDVVMLTSSKLCTRRALLQSLLFELRMPYRDLTEGELRLSLGERLQSSVENSSDGLILIVDEAQSLSLKLLEELRLLTNLTSNGMPRVRLVLVGTLRLDESLGHPRLESLNQRIASRCYLKPLTSEETARYIRHKVEICGAALSNVFTEDSVRALHRATDGIPRLIDQLADHSLCVACEQGQRPVSITLVERAWSDLQQLPPPWLPAQSASKVSTSIEFGTLDDDDEEFEQAEMAFENRSELPMGTPSMSEIKAEKLEEEGFIGTSYTTFSTFDGDNDSVEEIEATSSFAVEPAPSNFFVQPQVPKALDPFGSGFNDEIRVDMRAGSANSSVLRDEVESLESPVLGGIQIPQYDFEDSLRLDEATIEEDVREMISNLNMGSVALSSEPSLGPGPVPFPAPRNTFSTSTFTSQPQVLSFATLGNNGAAMGDDRDLLVVEEDLDVRHANPEIPMNSGIVQAQSPHSYVQLFSKLRG